MNYPNLTLRFDNHRAVLESQKSEDDVVAIDIGNVDREAFLQAVAAKLGVRADTAAILEGARMADEAFLEFPELRYSGEVLDTAYLLDEIQNAVDTYILPTDLDQPVADQLQQFWRYDVLASALEEFYNLLIAKVVLTGTEIGVGDFYVEDTEPRLLEKISKEFAEADINLYLPETEALFNAA